MLGQRGMADVIGKELMMSTLAIPGSIWTQPRAKHSRIASLSVMRHDGALRDLRHLTVVARWSELCPARHGKQLDNSDLYSS